MPILKRIIIVSLLLISQVQAASITKHPISQALVVGSGVSFSVSASGAGLISYQWKKNNTDIPGADTFYYSIAKVTSADAGLYRCVVKDGSLVAWSQNARLTVNVPPSITTQPVTQSFFEGSGLRLMVGVAGSPPFSFQWYLNNQAIAGATDGSYLIAKASSADAGSYTVKVTNVVDSAMSASATLTITAAPAQAPVILKNPQSVADLAGSIVVLCVTVSPISPAPTYKWFKNGVLLSGEDKNTLTISNLGLEAVGAYEVLVSNANGSVRSSQALVSLSTGYTVSTFAGVTPGLVDGKGSEARFSFPRTIAVDKSGNVFTGDVNNKVIRRIAQDGTVVTIAGKAGLPTGTGGPIGTDGKGAEAILAYPDPIACDPNGTLFVDDNGALKKVGIDGTVTTLSPQVIFVARGLAIDKSGVVFVSLPARHVIMRMAIDGTTSIFAGKDGVAGADDGYGADVRFNSPAGLAIDDAQNLYVADQNNHCIRKISPDGRVSTMAGHSGAQGSKDEKGSAARFSFPQGIAVTGAGTVYVADTDNHSIRKVLADGTVSTVAGYPGVKGSFDGRGVDARFNYPAGVAIDGAENIFVADTLNHTIRRITPDSTVTTLAGLVPQGDMDGPAATARFHTPLGLARNRSGMLYVADSMNRNVRSIWPSGQVYRLPTLAKNYQTPTFGLGTSSSWTYGVTVDSSGTLFVTEASNQIWKITPQGEVDVITGFVSDGINWLIVDGQQIGNAPDDGNVDGDLTNARFNRPNGLCFSPAGDMVIADTGNHTIRKISPSGIVTTFAGQTGASGLVDGFGVAARFKSPMSVAVNSAGDIFVAELGNGVVRRISSSGEVSVFAGSGNSTSWTVPPSGNTDGDATKAILGSLRSITIDRDDNLYLCSSGSVRKISPSGTVSTLAGHDAWNGAEDGVGSKAHFSAPQGIVVDDSGVIYVSDSGNNTIRRLIRNSLPEITQQIYDRGVQIGGNLTLSIETVPAGSITYQWFHDSAPVPGAMAPDLVLSNIKSSDLGSYMVLVSGAGGTTTSRLANVSLAEPTKIILNPFSRNVTEGGRLVLSVQASGVGTLGYQWKKNGVPISGATGSTLVVDGMGTSGAGSYTVLVTGFGGEVESSSANVTVGPASRLSALAVRTETGPGADVLTVGLAVADNSGAERKQFIVRGIGPGLQKDGIVGFLPDPEARVYSGTSLIASNDNWDAATMKAPLAVVGLDTLTVGSKDAAMIAQFADGGYSVQVGAKTEERGVAMAEIYESDSTTKAHMYAMSVRAKAGTAEKTLIAGFGIKGPVNKRLVIRGLGPALAGALGSGYLVDPKLEVYSGGTMIASNDNWGSTAELLAAFASVGLLPMEATSKDAALVVDLPPGGYSVWLTGVNNTTGVGLIEIYELP